MDYMTIFRPLVFSGDYGLKGHDSSKYIIALASGSGSDLGPIGAANQPQLYKVTQSRPMRDNNLVFQPLFIESYPIGAGRSAFGQVDVIALLHSGRTVPHQASQAELVQAAFGAPGTKCVPPAVELKRLQSGIPGRPKLCPLGALTVAHNAIRRNLGFWEGCWQVQEISGDSRRYLVAHLCSNWNQVLKWLNCMEMLRKSV